MKQSPPENDSYDAHARTCDPDDLWGQVKRTVNGKPLPDSQIDLILKHVMELLELSADDLLLDICCGNGALSHYWFARCANGVGVDASPYLIEIAQQQFSANTPGRFVLAEALDYLTTAKHLHKFTKAVCYGSLQYFSPARASAVLMALRQRCPALRRVVIGNIPDRDRTAAFFTQKMPKTTELDSSLAPIGVWHTQSGFSDLARHSGWHCCSHVMPENFYAAHYRFDAILTPLEDYAR